jgi:hypothetical protein
MDHVGHCYPSSEIENIYSRGNYCLYYNVICNISYLTRLYDLKQSYTLTLTQQFKMYAWHNNSVILALVHATHLPQSLNFTNIMVAAGCHELYLYQIYSYIYGRITVHTNARRSSCKVIIKII